MNSGMPVAFSSGPKPLFASGCATGAVFFGDVAQQVLLAQQTGWHAFSLGALMRTQGRAERRAGARTIAIANSNESAILPAIGSSS